MRQPTVFLRDLDPLALFWRKPLQLSHLPFKPLSLRLRNLFVLLEFVELFRQRLPAPVGIANRRDLGAQAGMVVEQFSLAVRLEQGLVRVLPVNVDQPFAQIAQLGNGGGDAVDEAARTPGAVDHAAQ